VVPAGATLGQHQIIPAVDLIEVGAFAKDVVLAQQLVHRTGQPQCFRIELLGDDTGETAAAGPEIPLHVAEPFAAVVVVEERRIETDGV